MSETGVPGWYKREIDAQDFKPCPDDEECDHCGRLVQYPMSLCCAHDIHDKKLLPVEDGKTSYPHPSSERVLERLGEVEEQLRSLAEEVVEWIELEFIMPGDDYEKRMRVLAEKESA